MTSTDEEARLLAQRVSLRANSNVLDAAKAFNDALTVAGFPAGVAVEYSKDLLHIYNIEVVRLPSIPREKS